MAGTAEGPCISTPPHVYDEMCSIITTFQRLASSVFTMHRINNLRNCFKYIPHNAEVCSFTRWVFKSLTMCIGSTLYVCCGASQPYLLCSACCKRVHQLQHISTTRCASIITSFHAANGLSCAPYMACSLRLTALDSQDQGPS